LGGLWALKRGWHIVVGGLWAWHPSETNLRCAGICVPNPSIVTIIVPERDFSVHPDRRTDVQMDMAKSTAYIFDDFLKMFRNMNLSQIDLFLYTFSDIFTFKQGRTL